MVRSQALTLCNQKSSLWFRQSTLEKLADYCFGDGSEKYWDRSHQLRRSGARQSARQRCTSGLRLTFGCATPDLITSCMATFNRSYAETYKRPGRTENPCVGGSNPPLPIPSSPIRTAADGWQWFSKGFYPIELSLMTFSPVFFLALPVAASRSRPGKAVGVHFGVHFSPSLGLASAVPSSVPVALTSCPVNV